MLHTYYTFLNYALSNSSDVYSHVLFHSVEWAGNSWINKLFKG